MKSWTAISLLNKSRLPVKQKAVYLKKAIPRLNLKLSKEHLLAANLSATDTAMIARKHHIPLKISEIFKSDSRKHWSVPEFLAIARIITADYDDIRAVFKHPSEQTAVLHHLDMKVSVAELMRPDRIGYELVPFARFLDRKPTFQEIRVFTRVSFGAANFADACIKFGYPLRFEDMIVMFNPFADGRTVFEQMTFFNTEMPSEYLIENLYPVDVLIRQLWIRACPIMYTLKLDQRYGGNAEAEFFKAKRSIRVIQRFARECRRGRAAKRIQRSWRKCVSDPNFEVAKARLVREFFQMN